ncbi:MAG: hypothetical protein U7123_14040 [Potamolinea sp.]
MTLNYSPSNKQSHLNLAQYQAQCAENLTTTNASALIRLLTGQEISRDDVLKRAKKGRFTIPYLHGTLIFTPSHRSKQGERYRLNMEFVPRSYIDYPTRS